MTWYFWILPFALFWIFGAGRRSRYRARQGTRRERMEQDSAERVSLLNQLDAQRTYITDLETRVAELENRLDFTERLLSTRREPAAAS